MVVRDSEEFMVEGRPGLTQCFEVKIHSCIYKTQPGVHFVVHVHPRYTVWIRMMGVLGLTLVPMRQEGIELVWRPLAVYPHVKTVQSDQEGMGLAALIGADPAILMQGHGPVPTGKTIAESCMAMMPLEEQARMNYLAYCVDGRGHPRVQDELIDEMTGRHPL